MIASSYHRGTEGIVNSKRRDILIVSLTGAAQLGAAPLLNLCGQQSLEACCPKPVNFGPPMIDPQ